MLFPNLLNPAAFLGWVSITLEIWTQYTWLFVCQYLFVLQLDCYNPGVCFLTQFQIQNCLKTLGWIILQHHQICHPMQGPFKLLFGEEEKTTIAFEKKMLKCINRGSKDHMKQALNLTFLPPNVKMGQCIPDQTYWKTARPHPALNHPLWSLNLTFSS